MKTIDIRQATEMKEGDGADVKRLMPVPGFMNYDPFVLWDDFTVKPGTGFPTHPHRGFEAITYMFEGTMHHEDNLGNKSTVSAGGAQRFTAGKGISHSEMPSPDGPSRGIQLWINLPKRLKRIPPDYQQVDADDFPQKNIDNGKLRTIVGDGSPLKLHTPVQYLDVQLQAGGEYSEVVPAEFRGLVYLIGGSATVCGKELETGDACFLEDIDALALRAHRPCRFMVCLGKPHREPIRQWGPFVD